MPIEYNVYYSGNLVHIITCETVTDEDIVNLKLAISNDGSINSQASRLFEVMPGSTLNGTLYGILDKLSQCRLLSRKTGCMCAVCASYNDKEAWNLAYYYKKVYEMYSPFSAVMLFADLRTARRWLGYNKNEFVIN